jgi:hypothetical protein
VKEKIIEKKPLEEAKRTWKKPILTRLGHLKDFVQGHGKTGSGNDADPFSMRRRR